MSVIIAGGAIGAGKNLTLKLNKRVILGCIVVILFSVSFVPAISSIFNLGITTIFFQIFLPLEIVVGMLVCVVSSIE